MELVELRSRFGARGLRFQSTLSKKKKKKRNAANNNHKKKNPELCPSVKYGGGGDAEVGGPG